jgi:hypothetical protein
LFIILFVYLLYYRYGIIGGGIVVIAAFVWPKRSYVETTKTKNVQDAAVDEPTMLELVQKSKKGISSLLFLLPCSS